MVVAAHVVFDTLKYADTLIMAGIPERQAKAFVHAQAEAFEEMIDKTLATKSDLFEVKNELKIEIANVKAELKADIAGVKTELKADIAGVKAELKTEIAEVRFDVKLLKWMLGFVFAGVSTLILKAFF